MSLIYNSFFGVEAIMATKFLKHRWDGDVLSDVIAAPDPPIASKIGAMDSTACTRNSYIKISVSAFISSSMVVSKIVLKIEGLVYLGVERLCEIAIAVSFEAGDRLQKFRSSSADFRLRFSFWRSA